MSDSDNHQFFLYVACYR